MWANARYETDRCDLVNPTDISSAAPLQFSASLKGGFFDPRSIKPRGPFKALHDSIIYELMFAKRWTLLKAGYCCILSI